MSDIKVLIIITIIFLFTSSISGATSPPENEASDMLLMNSSSKVNFRSLDNETGEEGVSFAYANLDKSVFQHASGLIIVTPVNGNENEIKVDFNLNILFMSGDEFNIEINGGDFVLNGISVSELPVNIN